MKFWYRSFSTSRSVFTELCITFMPLEITGLRRNVTSCHSEILHIKWYLLCSNSMQSFSFCYTLQSCTKEIGNARIALQPKASEFKKSFIVLELFLNIVFHNSFIGSFPIAVCKCIPVFFLKIAITCCLRNNYYSIVYSLFLVTFFRLLCSATFFASLSCACRYIHAAALLFAHFRFFLFVRQISV